MIRKLLVVLSLLILSMAGSNVTYAAGTDKALATWVWNTWEIKSQPDQMLSFLQSKGVNKLYLQIDYDMDNASYHDFIVKANQQHIDVYALNGSSEWVAAGNQSMYQQFIDWLQQYQKQYPDSGSFKGVHLDVEPHVLPEWNTNRDAVIQRFQDMIMNFKTFTTSNNLVLDCDIPFWDYTITYSNNIYSSGNLAEWIIKNVDGITIMAYRDTADSIVGVSSTEMNLAAQYGKKAVIGVETLSEPDEPFITFYDEGEVYMENELSKVTSQYTNNAGYDGNAVHYYDSWSSLKP